MPDHFNYLYACMKPIILPVDRELIEKELTEDKLLRKTNNGNNLLYVVTHQDSPNIMTEIGRLREISFRVAGGGTGKEVDIDMYDTMPDPYKQIIVWDPAEKEILGGYRYFICSEAAIVIPMATAIWQQQVYSGFPRFSGKSICRT